MLSRERPALPRDLRRRRQGHCVIPERGGIVLCHDVGERAQAALSFLEDEWTPSTLESGGIAAQDLCARAPSGETKQTVGDR